MAARPTHLDPDAALLSRMLKGIRRRRGLKVAQVAQAMGIATRTYANGEAGRQRIDVARIHQFAQLVGADPYAILVAVDIRSPSFALRCMEHQFMAMLMVLIQDFDARAPDSFARMDPRLLYAAAHQFFDGLLAQSQEIDASLERWMLDRSLHESAKPEDPDEREGDPHDSGSEG
jgi:transcriptional regulator with XRE-family HTH domain